MDRPLWQFFLAILFVFFAIQRGAIVAMVVLSDGDAAQTMAYGFQVALGLATALGVWLGRSWVMATLLGLGACVAATALLEGFFLDVRSAASAVSQTLVAAVATGGIFFLLRHESLG